MIAVTLTEDQFAAIIGNASLTEKSLKFLQLVYVDGLPVPEAAARIGVRGSRGYNIASDFRSRYNDWLVKNKVKPKLTFVSAA